MIYDYMKPGNSPVFAPVMDFQLSDYLQEQQQHLKGLVDTGYDGEVLIPMEIYLQLNLDKFEFAENVSPQVKTATGEIIQLRSASATLKPMNSDIEFTVTVDTFSTASEILIGRQFLEPFLTHMNGVKKTLELHLL